MTSAEASSEVGGDAIGNDMGPIRLSVHCQPVFLPWDKLLKGGGKRIERPPRDRSLSRTHARLSPTFFMSAAADPTNAPLSFSGHEYFRQRLVLSILSGRPVRIDKIRSADANPGLRGPSI